MSKEINKPSIETLSDAVCMDDRSCFICFVEPIWGTKMKKERINVGVDSQRP